ncbi:MAG: cyclic nucleotide-binding domain-containing protein [Bacteroidetes bacterium]|nr:cyclic nucleotide-binding domain-containing protein [Bacteroidota bacterium]
MSDSTNKSILFDFLNSFKKFSSEEIEGLADKMLVKGYAKNSIVVKQGEHCHLCFFVLKGCLRQYILNAEAEEKTIAFYTEGQSINYFTSRLNNQETESTLQCLEDSVLLVGDPERDEMMYVKYPQLIEITRQMLEAEFGYTQDAFAKFISASPEERYLNLQKDRPDLLQRVPQYQLASFLGMTPESLSRIKRRVSRSGKHG